MMTLPILAAITCIITNVVVKIMTPTIKLLFLPIVVFTDHHKPFILKQLL